MEISAEEIKETIEQPDKVLGCAYCDQCFYLKRFRGKGELLVKAKITSNDEMNIVCFGWLETVLYPSNVN